MNDKTVMIADMVKNLALLLIRQDDTLTMKEALSYVFNSDTYRKIINEETRLYYQSPRYVFAFLDEEIKKGKIG